MCYDQNGTDREDCCWAGYAKIATKKEPGKIRLKILCDNGAGIYLKLKRQKK